MATYFLSTNPTISNFAISGDTLDTFINDTTTPAGRLSISQVGANVVISNGTNTATLQNFSIDQISTNVGQTAPATVQFLNNDGSVFRIGNGTAAIDPTSVDATRFNAAAGATLSGAVSGFANRSDLFFGLEGADSVNGIGGNDVIYLQGGADILRSGAATAGDRSTIFGGQGNDVIQLTDSVGGATANPYLGAALIFGNLGDDVIDGSVAGVSGANTVFGGQGNDSINFAASTGNQTVYGDVGNDFIAGGAGNDTLFGGDGSDTINGGAGSNQVYGNQGDDFLNVAPATGAGTTSTVFGGQGRDTITVTAAAAADGNALLFGNLDSDTMTGGAGNDTLFGGQGNDLLTGGLGADVLSGDLGTDYYVQTIGASNAGAADATTTTGLTTASADTVVGWNSADRFVTGLANGDTSNYTEFTSSTVTSVETAVTAAVNNYGVVGNRAYTFIAGATDGYVVFNEGGNATADGVTVLRGVTSLDQVDITNFLNAAPTTL